MMLVRWTGSAPNGVSTCLAAAVLFDITGCPDI